MPVSTLTALVRTRKTGILFILFCIFSITLIPTPCTALADAHDAAGAQITARGYFFPMLPVYIAPLQVATQAPVNISTARPQYTFQTAQPTKTTAPATTTLKPILQTQTAVPVRTAATVPFPSLSVLQTRAAVTAVTFVPTKAPVPQDGNCPPAFFSCNGSCIVDSHENCRGCGIACRPDQTCVNSQCSCGRDSALCNSVCIPTYNDAANCGGCNIRCLPNQTCSNGYCECSQGTTFCNGTCIATGTDVLNCGQCGRSCGPSQRCADGHCSAECAGMVTNVDTNPRHCGTCGHSCAADEWCSRGTCTKIPCPYNTRFCNGECVNILENPQNCGICNRICAYPDRYCYAGNCLPSCPGGWADCDEDGRCEDLSSGSGGYYCGSCDSMCRYNEACFSGRCWVTCPQGLSKCNRGCHSLTTDPDNCGECGTRCSNTEICEHGTCIPRCPDGSQRCDGRCMSWTEFYYDNNNCGTCGNRCAIVCAMGICLWG